MTRTARPTEPPHHARLSPAVRWTALLTLVCALLLPLSTLSVRAQDGGQATIVVTSYQDDGTTPLPFARFQATDSYGNVYPARESAPPDGVALLTVDVIDDATTYTVAEETPPACGVAPEPQEVGPLAAGEEVAISFSTGFEEGCDLGSISVYSYTCPEGLDLTVTDYAQYRDSCLTTNDGAQFTVADADGGGSESFDITTGEFGIPGRAVVVGLTPDDYLLTERENDSGLASLIYCLTFEGLPGDGFEPTAVEQKLPNADGEVELELDGGRIACDVFRVVGNLPANTGGEDGGSDDGDARGPDDERAASDDQGDDSAEDLDDIFDDGDSPEGDTEAQGDEAASIEFHVATCPVGYDGPDYYNVCSASGAEGVSFSVTGEDTGYAVTSAPSAQPVDPGFGITTVAGLPADTYTMVSSVPGHDAEVFVYCADQPGGGPRVQTPSDDGYQFAIALSPGQDVICDWYLLPYDLAGGGGTAILRLTAFACAPGYGGATFGEITADCLDPAPDVEFNLLSDDAGYDVDETTNADGKARFLDIPENDDYVLDEDLPGDVLDDRLAYCAVDGGDYIEYDASTGTIQLDPILDGQEVQCLWYIVPTDQTPDPTATATVPPADETAVVRLTAFTCEPGYGGTGFGELTADCADVAQGVAFSLIGNVLETGVDIKRTTNADGKIRYAGIPAGTYILVEDAQDVPVDSLAYRAAFCAVNGAPYVEYDVAELGVANLDPIAAGDEVQCLWFDVPVDDDPATSTPRPEPTATREPAEPGSLRIHKSECPPGQREDFYDDCYEDVVGGIGFNVQGPDGYDRTGTTSNQGIVTFDDMPPGDYVVTELQPADYAVDLYVVVCSRDGQIFETDYDDSTGLRVDLDLPEGADIVCDWYNVPPGPPPTPTPAPNVGTITIVASLCEMEAAEVVSYADDCDPYGDGAEFRLTAASGGASKTGTTGNDSRLVFTDLRPGAYALEETSLDWCKAQADAVDSDGNVLVTKSRNTNVYIYNCLPDGKPAPGEPGGSKAVTTLPSTGTGGSAAQTARRGLSLATWGIAALAAVTVAGSLIAFPAVASRRRTHRLD